MEAEEGRSESMGEKVREDWEEEETDKSHSFLFFFFLGVLIADISE